MDRKNNRYISLILMLLMLCSLNVSAENNIVFLEKKTISNLAKSVYEIVVPKIESSKIKYARELPFEKLGFTERNEKYYSVGTAFFINDKELMSAAHVFGLQDYSLYYNDVYIRDSEGNTYKIKNIIKYSDVRDMAVFDLESYPESLFSLAFSEETEIGDTVFSVGNVQGEGISFRAGQIAAFTFEPEYGKWKDIRFTAPASPGNSGGPLVNVKGDVVGLIVKKNSSENHNVAVPITEVANLSDDAEFLLRNVTLTLRDEQNNITRDWKASFELPETVSKLSNAAQMSLNKFYSVMGLDLGDKFKESYFPKGNRFRAYLRNQQFIRNFGVLESDVDFNEWSLNNYSTKTIPLQKDQNIKISSSDISTFHVIIEKPVALSLAEFIGNPEIVMDNILKGIPITRTVGAEKIRVTSLGEPESIDLWQDKLGRKWVSSLWFIPYLDAYAYSHCLAYPGGAICNVDFKENSELYKGYFELVKQNYDEIAIGYEGEVADWLEYFSLDKKYLPRVFEGSKMSLSDDIFKFKVGDYDLVLQSGEINNKSNIHFHFGYSNYDLLAESLLLFELFPTKGINAHYRILKYYSPSEFSSDEYKTTWSEVDGRNGDYSGELIKKDGKYSVQKVIASTTKSENDIKSVYIVRCISDTMKEDIESNCERFSAAVEFHVKEKSEL